MSLPRYAVYYAPEPGSELWRLGSALIGYDAAISAEVPYLIPEGYQAEDWPPIVAEPRRYGFHATLKAPFRLAAGTRPEPLLTAVEALASSVQSIRLGRLQATVLDRFVALTSPADETAIARLAQTIVEALEPLRAPLTEAEFRKRRPETLSPRQRELLTHFGYPYVAEQFRFHMTLSGPVAAERVEPLRAGLQRLVVERMGEAETDLDRLCVFEQPDPDSRFRVLAAFRLRRPAVAAG